MNAVAADVRSRLFGVLGVERYVLRARGDEPVSIEGKRLAIACGRDVDAASGGRYQPLLKQLLATLSLKVEDAVIVAKLTVDLPTICFGTEPGDRIDALLAPPLATLRQSAAAKKSLWKSLRQSSLMRGR